MIVINPNADQHGARKENVFIVLDGNGVYAGSLLIYPYFAYDMEPEHPHNLFLYLHSPPGQILSETVKDLLLDKALIRAEEIKKEDGQTRTRVYTSFIKDNQERIDYFLQRGFLQDESMLILERPGDMVLPDVVTPVDVRIQRWEMDTAAEEQHFINEHKKIFPRHPYSHESLQALKSKPGWQNYTAFRGTEIAGNVMLFTKSTQDSIGWIEDLFVHKDWRKCGIGKDLLYTALVQFQQIDIQRVQLEVWSANKPALNLYYAFGFAQVDETEIAVGRYI
jgi:GNAT superfamily N-acetyltransferase